MRAWTLFLNVVLFTAANAIDWSVVKKGRLATVGPRIINGHDLAPHAVPSQVGILINGVSFCGGSLISANYVLTAAHCGVVIVTAEVILGAHNITNTDEATQVHINVATVTLHPEYDNIYYTNDLALLKLETPAPINEYIQVANLSKKADADKSYVYQTVLTIGWGLTKDNDYAGLDDLSGVLQGLNVSVIPKVDCTDYYNDEEQGMIYVTDKNICTSGYQDKGTCNGDSGGPLISNGVQIGVVSFGTRQCELCAPSAFTNVGKFLDWIEENSDVVIE